MAPPGAGMSSLRRRFPSVSCCLRGSHGALCRCPSDRRTRHTLPPLHALHPAGYKSHHGKRISGPHVSFMHQDFRRRYCGGALDMYQRGPECLEHLPCAGGQLDTPGLGPISFPGKANRSLRKGFENDVTVGPWVWRGDRGLDQAAHTGVKATEGQGQGAGQGMRSRQSFLPYSRHRLVPSGS